MVRETGGSSLPVLLVVLALCALLPVSCRPPAPSYSGSGYLIVAPEALQASVQDLADYKQGRGFLVDRVSLEEVLAGTPGGDDPEKLRNYLAEYAGSTAGREFVLLVGSMATMPMRIAHPDRADHSLWSAVPTDFYYEELTGVWDADGDGYFGEYGDDMSVATDDYRAELLVGRIPWDDPAQVAAIGGSIIAYEEDVSARMQKAIGAAAVIAAPCDAALYVEVAKGLVIERAGYQTTTLYEDCPTLAPDFPLSRTDFLGQWQAQQPGLVAWFSHGNDYGSYYGESPYTFIDVDNLPLGAAPAVGITSGCVVGAPDTESLGRVLVREGVCASFLGSARSTWFGDDPGPAFQSQFEIANSFIWERRALAEAKIISLEMFVALERVPENLEGRYFHQDLFQFMIYGDPSIQLRF